MLKEFLDFLENDIKAKRQNHVSYIFRVVCFIINENKFYKENVLIYNFPSFYYSF